MDANDARVVPVFKTHSRKNEAKSREAGRPIFDDIEVVEVRMAGNRQHVGVFPAHAYCRTVTMPDGSTEEQTYAMRFNEQYRRFKQNRQQVQEGTPLEELPFLTQGKRLELKALQIHTAEALAALDGNELKNLGMGGRDLKNQAQSYIDNAKGSALVTKQAQEIEELKARLEAAEKAKKPANKAKDEDQFDAMDEGEIKAWLKEKTGETPRGNPSRETLLSSARELAGEGK